MFFQVQLMDNLVNSLSLYTNAPLPYQVETRQFASRLKRPVYGFSVSTEGSWRAVVGHGGGGVTVSV